jgi:hypothetical protein
VTTADDRAPGTGPDSDRHAHGQSMPVSMACLGGHNRPRVRHDRAPQRDTSGPEGATTVQPIGPREARVPVAER